MSTVYLIRHGKTPANEAHLYCGSTDVGLSQAGMEELRQLHYSIRPEKIYTSGMKRTEQTLELLFGPLPHEINPEFREIDFGVFEMQSYDQLKDREDYQAWITGDNDANVPPRGESGNQMTARVLRALKPLLESPVPVLVVTHGGVIAAIMEHLFPNEEKSRYQWQPRPGHGYALEDGSYRPLP